METGGGALGGELARSDFPGGGAAAELGAFLFDSGGGLVDAGVAPNPVFVRFSMPGVSGCAFWTAADMLDALQSL